MLKIDPRAAQQIQPELFSDESILWAAMPNPKKIFHSDDWSVIPFSAIWLGFVVFWELDALGWTGKHQSDWFMQLWGIPFLIFGNFMLWGRFLYDAWLKRRTYYAITNRRAILLQDRWRGPNKTFVLTREISEISQEGSAAGTIWLGPKYPLLGGRGQRKRNMSRFYFGDVPVLADIDDVNAVHRLLSELSLSRYKSG